MTEEDIIKLIRTGGKAMDAGVKALYGTAAQPMLRFFAYKGASGDDAQDVLQETFIRIIRSAESFSGQGPAKAWIWQIARNCLIDYFRKDGASTRLANALRAELGPEHDEAAANDEGTVDPEEIANSLAASRSEPAGSVDECVSVGLDKFSRREPTRGLVLMLQLDGMRVDEIGLHIGRTAKATKEYLSQCRKKLQPYIAHCTELLAG